MVLHILLLIVSLALVLGGANYLVEGSSSIAKRIGLSDFVIGLTIVAIGTSAPELVVSCISSFNGNADIAVGNVIGSNIFNILVIIGITAIVLPVRLTSDNIRKDIPFCVLATFILTVLGMGSLLNNDETQLINRTDGIMLLCFFAVFMAYTIFSSQSGSGNSNNSDSSSSAENSSLNNTKPQKIWLSILMVLGGLAALIFGGDLFVKKASIIAKLIGVSDAVIAITIMAGGTSLPELATSVVAAIKKNTDLALGNVIGSNISNIFLVLGLAATINPLSVNGISQINFVILMISAIMLFLSAFTFKRKEIDRTEGIIFILLYIAFIIMLLK